MAVSFLASLVVSFTAFNGLPAPAAGLTAGEAASVSDTDVPTPGAAVAGPTQVVHPAAAIPDRDPAATPRPTLIPSRPGPRAHADAGSDARSDARGAGGPTGYVWPLRGRLTLGFEHSGWGSRLVKGERFHDGIDVATSCGDRIRAAHRGVVLAAGRHFDDYVGWIGDLKPYYRRLNKKDLWDTLPIAVVIDDGNGYRSIYAHFAKVRVKAGRRRQGRGADRLGGRHRAGVRLPPPLRPVQPVRNEAVRAAPGHRQAHEAAALGGRPGEPAAGAAVSQGHLAGVDEAGELTGTLAHNLGVSPVTRIAHSLEGLPKDPDRSPFISKPIPARLCPECVSGETPR